MVTRAVLPAAFVAIASMLLLGSLPLNAEAVKDREGAVRGDRAKMEHSDRWIYQDLERGFAEAKKSGKPLLVVLRCVPCKACMGIDASILTSDDLQPLLDQFVCVRIINANALDLSLFQFDYDLSFSTLFFNADRTVYGRYGSWQHQRDSNDATLAGYKAALTAKQGGVMPFKVPVEFPTLAGKYERELNWEGKVVQSCVHCHQIGDAYRAYYRGAGKPVPQELIYPMPAPETIGLTLDTQKAATVKGVTEGSAAAAAGLKAGDEIASVNGQPLISIADFAWILHHTGDSGALKIALRRAGKKEEHTVNLADGWRSHTDISTRVGTWPMRVMAFGGMILVDLDDATRGTRGLPNDGMGLLVKFVGAYGPHGEAKKAGFQVNDVLVSVDGSGARLTESQIIGKLLTAHPTKEQVKATVLRGTQRIDLMLPMQ
jgi:serine protease Do